MIRLPYNVRVRYYSCSNKYKYMFTVSQSVSFAICSCVNTESLFSVYYTSHLQPMSIMPDPALKNIDNQSCLTLTCFICLNRDRIKSMFYHAYNSYLENAYPYDELRPLTCDGQDTWGRYVHKLFLRIPLLEMTAVNFGLRQIVKNIHT